MKTLNQYAVLVTNTEQYKVAVSFFKRAAKKESLAPTAEDITINRPVYVGLDKFLKDTVAAAYVKYPHEQTVMFSQIGCLADTPSRKRALAKAKYRN